MSRLRVLLVDDSAAFLKASEGLLTSWPGIEVVASTLSGRAAVEQISSLRPDLVLVDLTMPGMDGLATTRLIKRGTDAPFVFIMTLHDEPGFREAAMACGADAFIGKSDFHKFLLPLIEQVCSMPHQERHALL